MAHGLPAPAGQWLVDAKRGLYKQQRCTDTMGAESVEDKARRLLRGREKYRERQAAENVQDKQKRLTRLQRQAGR